MDTRKPAIAKAPGVCELVLQLHAMLVTMAPHSDVFTVDRQDQFS